MLTYRDGVRADPVGEKHEKRTLLVMLIAVLSSFPHSFPVKVIERELYNERIYDLLKITTI